MIEQMTEDQGIGMFIGMAIGDALGAPLEFIPTQDIKKLHTEMTGGGVHETSAGEWTDDTAMGVAIAEAYVQQGGFCPATIAKHFRQWKASGKYGTRNYVFDIGNTCSSSIHRLTQQQPYAGSTDDNASGNGSIMRMAPIVLANHSNAANCVGQSVAVALMTHGNAATINYITAFATELYAGDRLLDFKQLSNYDCEDRRGKGSIMHAYTQAWRSVITTESFEDALIHAVNKGHDADTVGAVTGMAAGRIYGYKNIPKRWTKVLMAHDYLYDLAQKLYQMGKEKTCH
jgi:ADP-ribosyl-[dinitrogen reductase] hydrolase